MPSTVDVSLTIDDGEAAGLIAGLHHDPHTLLGASLAVDSAGRRCVLVRAWRPEAVAVAVLIGDERAEMERVHPAGLFATALPGDSVPDYRLEVSYRDGVTVIVEDPYRFWPTVGELDLHLFGEGRHEGLWRHLGAHPRVHQGVAGTSFAVWAPNAQAVRVVGDFNGWDGRVHPMRMLGSSGVWELFLPTHGLARGTSTKCSASTGT